MDSVFPIHVYCEDRSGGGSYELRPYFLKAKPKDMVWYAFDAIVHSRTDVEFIAYDMRDSVYGGVGKEISRFKAIVPATATEPTVERRIHILAAARRAAELEAAESAIVAGYANEIRQKLEAA